MATTTENYAEIKAALQHINAKLDKTDAKLDKIDGVLLGTDYNGKKGIISEHEKLAARVEGIDKTLAIYKTYIQIASASLTSFLVGLVRWIAYQTKSM